MGAASPTRRRLFTSDLSAALSIANSSTTTKTRKASDTYFELWTQFCADLGHEPSLSSLPDQEARLGYLLVFGLRYRQTGQTGKPVRADSVDKALLAVGQGFTHLGQPDPRKLPGQDKFHPVFDAFLRGLRKEDAPASRVYPCNITIIQQLQAVLDTSHHMYGRLNAHAIDLIIVAFFWLLRPAEYLDTSTPGARSQAFCFRDIYLTIDGKVYCAPDAPLNDPTSLERLTQSALRFGDQKNAVRGETVGHATTSDPFFCPSKALFRLARHLHQHDASPDTPIFRHYNSHFNSWYSVKPSHITNSIRHAAGSIEDTTGIPPSLLSARSLRPGGATALLCANVDKDAIALLGRWKSDAMLRYLRIQAHTHSANFAQRMWEAGAYTFAPGASLPGQVPPGLAQVLQHHELYTD